MKKLWIEEVYCREQEDYTGYDNCRIDVTVDGELVAVLRKNMSDSEANRRKWVVQKGFVYSNAASIKVWEEDDADADDPIASISVNTATALGVSKKNYTQSGNYDITFGVQAFEGEVSQTAEGLIKEFERSTRAGVWKNIAKPALIADLRNLINNPAANILQSKAPFCGPASVLYALAKRNNAKLVKMCQDLYETGQFNTQNLAIKASTTLKNSKVGFNMSLANWILQASIRDALNATIDIDSNTGGLGGITTPGEMQQLGKELLGLTLTHTSTYAWGEVDAIKYANKKVNEGGVGFLLIDASMLPGQSQSTVFYPNHWVVLEGGLQIDPGVYDTFSTGNITFNCWTWGQKIKVKASEEKFEDCFFGVVA